MDVMIAFAKEELRRLRASDEPDRMQDMIDNAVLQVVEIFSNQGHSGSSAPYVIGILQKVLMFEPVTPLTGEDAEWTVLDYSDDMKAQNKRCSHVFKRADGTAYDGEGRIFQHEDGKCFTGPGSRVDITFPYRPTRQYVKVDASGVPLNEGN